MFYARRRRWAEAHASRFVFLASAIDDGTDRWRVLLSLVVLGLSLPLLVYADLIG